MYFILILIISPSPNSFAPAPGQRVGLRVAVTRNPSFPAALVDTVRGSCLDCEYGKE